MENKAVGLSQSAKDRIIELQSKIENQNKHLRITVFGGGCNGLRYEFELELDEKINDDDFQIASENIVFLTIDKVSLEFICGGVVDFVCDLGSSYFKINNPNAKSNCGCGDSFSV